MLELQTAFYVFFAQNFQKVNFMLLMCLGVDFFFVVTLEVEVNRGLLYAHQMC